MGSTLLITLKLILAVTLGGCVGVERQYFGKPAGVRTYSLVSLGSALFTIMALEFFSKMPNIDPSRIAAQVVVGIGFIGAGMIIIHRRHIEGLTTAAALWTAAAVGMAIGIGWYWEAILTTFLVFIILNVFGRFDIKKKKTLWEKITNKRKKKSLFK